jgi:hypothetical protein
MAGPPSARVSSEDRPHSLAQAHPVCTFMPADSPATPAGPLSPGHDEPVATVCGDLGACPLDMSVKAKLEGKIAFEARRTLDL